MGLSCHTLVAAFYEAPVCMADMYESKKLVCAAGDYSARYVCSAVRDSRMWGPHDIGRDSWVWEEQGTLEMMRSPHEVEDEALTERSPFREGAGWPVDVSGCCCSVAVLPTDFFQTCPDSVPKASEKNSQHISPKHLVPQNVHQSC